MTFTGSHGQERTHHHHVDHDDDLRGVMNPDFLALGLGGTNMMSMLWTVAMGRRAVGIEMRGDPFLGVHWNIRADLYHQLGLIDQMMMERYGEAGVPRRANGLIFRLADCFYHKDTVAGDIVPDEIIDGYDVDQHIVGTIHHVEFIDDRWRDGLPNRTVTLLQPPAPPQEPDPKAIRTDMIAVLDGPSTFQTGAAALLILLRRYLEAIEEMDLASDTPFPRVRLFTRHRALSQKDGGFAPQEDGRLAISVEALQELDFRGKFLRVRAPGTAPIDVGVPELFMIAQGFDSADARRLGFEQADVAVDHGDGRGETVAQADFLAGLIEVLVGGRLRRRICSEFDAQGKEYWTRQIAVGHENDPEVGWVLIQVPDFKTFDPVEAGLIGADADPDSPEFFAAYQQLVYDYYMEQAANILELPKSELKKVQMVYGPKLFSLIERMGQEAQIAPNGVVAGDSFGNGHFLTSGGAMTGMVGHSAAVLRYWEARDAGTAPDAAIKTLARDIREATQGWLDVSAKEYSQAVPINFGAERIAEIAAKSGVDASARAHSIDTTRRKRHSLLPLDPSDWRRLFLRNGRVLSAPLPELHAMHPALRSQTARAGAKTPVVCVVPHVTPDSLPFLAAVLGQPGARVGLVSAEPADALPQDVRERLAGHVQVPGLSEAGQIVEAARALAQTIGAPRALLGAPDMELAMAQARGTLNVRGLDAAAAQRLRDPAAIAAAFGEAGATFDPAADAQADNTLEIMFVAGVPAFYASTRRRAGADGAVALTMPKEENDPADPATRQAAFGVLRRLGMTTGLATVRWLRRDGAAVFTAIAPHAPHSTVVALMGVAHGADMHRAWANAVVNGLFAPIPRVFAAGLVTAPGAHVESLRRTLGAMVVGAQPVGADQVAILLKHAQTAEIDRAIEGLLVQPAMAS